MSDQMTGFNHRRIFDTAFTRIELLVVIAILATLAASLIPSLAKSKAAAKSIACLDNRKQLNFCLHLYQFFPLQRDIVGGSRSRVSI